MPDRHRHCPPARTGRFRSRICRDPPTSERAAGGRSQLPGPKRPWPIRCARTEPAAWIRRCRAGIAAGPRWTAVLPREHVQKKWTCRMVWDSKTCLSLHQDRAHSHAVWVSGELARARHNLWRSPVAQYPERFMFELVGSENFRMV